MLNVDSVLEALRRDPLWGGVLFFFKVEMKSMKSSVLTINSF